MITQYPDVEGNWELMGYHTHSKLLRFSGILETLDSGLVFWSGLKCTISTQKRPILDWSVLVFLVMAGCARVQSSVVQTTSPESIFSRMYFYSTPLIPPSAWQQPLSTRQTCSAIARRVLGGILHHWSPRALAKQWPSKSVERSVGFYRWFWVTFACWALSGCCRALGGISGVGRCWLE